jgi:PAS domain S-box-containing protein
MSPEQVSLDELVALRSELAKLRTENATLKAQHGIHLDQLTFRGPLLFFRWQLTDGYPVLAASFDENVLGYAPSDFISGRVTWNDVVHPDDEARVIEELRRAIANKRDNVTLRYRLKRADGQLSWVQDNVQCKGGDPPLLDSLVIDISEQLEVQRSRHEIERQHFETLETLELAVVMLDTKGYLRYANTYFQRLLGVPYDRALERKWSEFIPEEDHAFAKNIFLRTIAEEEGVPASCEFSIRCPEGVRLFRWHNTLRCDPAGKIIGTASIGEDITDLRRTEGELRQRVEELARSEQRLLDREKHHLSMLSSFPEVLYVVDPETNRLLFVNDTVSKTLGRNPVGELCYAALDRFDQPCENCSLATLRQGRPTVIRETHKSQLKMDLLITDRMIRWSDGREVMFKVATDITERKRLQRQVLQAQKMEAVGQLAGGVAHDFNNTLQAAMGFSSLLELELEPDSPAESMLAEINGELSRAAALTRQLLAFARRQPHKASAVDLNELIRGLLKMIRRLIREDIELSFEADKDTPTIWADPGHIEQVLVNLCVNARDAMPSGGSLIIETGLARFQPAHCAENTWARPGCYARLSVRDTGVGMSARVRERIFEPFFTTKAVGEGSGLGLATVYGVVKQHDGFLNVESSPGNGTHFMLFLPESTSNQEQAETQERVVAPMAGSETVLLAEDEPRLRAATSALLSRAGYKVLEARNGIEALDLIEQYSDRIGLALIDAVMPGASGKEVSEALSFQQHHIPIIMTTGYNKAWLEERGDISKESLVLSKPYDSKRLLSLVRNVLDG